MILIVDLNSKKVSLGFTEFVLPLVTIVEKLEPCEIKHYTEIKSEKINNYSKIILSGTPLKENEYRMNIKRFDWIDQCNRPILGICAGFQVIGAVFNSAFQKCQEIGLKEIKTLKENPLFASNFKAYELHNYTIKPSKTFEILATSDKCIQGIKHKEKGIYGVLFHPEVRNKEIVKYFVLRI
ncbi:MAG: hypothetical protein ACE5R6_13955 [Candidatus Heimdallarchaeota archaeon]